MRFILLFESFENSETFENTEQLEKKENVGERKAFTFLISGQVIDEVLTSGGDEQDSILRIIAYFKKDHLVSDNAAFLKKEYGVGGKGFIIGISRVSVWFNEDGIYLAVGDTALNATGTTLITWERAARRIRELLDMGRYASQAILDQVDDYEIKRIAESIWYLHQDLRTDVGFTFIDSLDFSSEGIFKDGFPDSTARIKELLKSPVNQQEIIVGLQEFAINYEKDRSLLRFGFAITHLKKALTGLVDLQCAALEFSAHEQATTAKPSFITQDELDQAICGGSGFQYGKFRIYSYFLQGHTLKEKSSFLKEEHGIGGSTHHSALKQYNNKGLIYSRWDIFTPYNNVTLTWSKVAKRIDKLIADDKYMSKEELDYIPEYEKGILATGIYLFYYNQPEEVIRPYYLSEQTEAVKVIRPQLDDSTRIDEILKSMEDILDSTAVAARNYESMQKAFDNLTAYQAGTYSLFGKVIPSEKEQTTIPSITSSELTSDLKLTIEWSEHPVFYDQNNKDEHGSFQSRYADISFALGNKLLGVLDAQQHRDREIYNVGWYHKTGFRIHAAWTESDEVNYEGRFDIGDGNGNLIDHIKAFYDYSLSPNCAHIPIWKKEGEESYQQKIKELKYGREKFVTFLERNVELTPADHQLFAEIMATESDWFPNKYDDLDVEEESERISETTEHEDNGDLIGKEVTIGTSEYIIEDINSNDVVCLGDASRYNYQITNDELGYGGAKLKYRRKIEAIQTLQKIEQEVRLATPEEQDILIEYVGWGGLPQAFDLENKQWSNEYTELKNLLSEKEYASARSSTLNAHYTSPIVIKAMYQALVNMGFRRGNILEPGCGTGHFMGLLPNVMNESKFYGVELDDVTGRITKQLYQKNNITIQGFENAEFPDSFFDIAIGNVPFGDYKVSDKRYDQQKFNIHDYFFAKTLDKVRPNGIIAFITSKGTLDKANPTVRKYIAQRAELLGAIRLPNTAFKANAGTQVTSDIIFLQKRERMIDITDKQPEWVHLGKTEAGIPVNSYFLEHPYMILGRMTMEDTMYGNAKETACVPLPDTDLATQLTEAISNIKGQVIDHELDDVEYTLDDEELEDDWSIPADPNVRNYSYTVVDGKIYYRQDSRMKQVKLSLTAQNRVKGLIQLRECTRNLIAYQINNYSEAEIKKEQEKLNQLYDDYTNKYGLINSRGNNMAFSADSSYYLLCSLEQLNEHGELEHKADIFYKRTIRAHTPVTHVDNASEALAVSLNEKGKVDLTFMTQLTGKSEDVLVGDLEQIIFLNPAYKEHDPSEVNEDKYVTADAYLSGNIRDKLKLARRGAELNPTDYMINVQALEAALPKDLTAAEIEVRLGAIWVPEDVFEQFTYELLKTSNYAQSQIRIHYIYYTGEWNITNKNYDRSNVNTTNAYGTKRISAYKIIEESLNLRDVRVYDYTLDEHGNKKPELNKKETAIAQAKQELIRSEFASWIWIDPERRERLCRIYNHRFNSIRLREYDGSHLQFPNINPEITFRKHQLDAIARGLYSGNMLLGHPVGAGKTFVMIAIAMEAKRLGISNKSMVVVPNHLIDQWATDILRLYPSANVLVTTKKEFEKRNRKKFCARIATGDYDIVVIGHSQFEKIPMSIERQKAQIEQEIDEVIGAIQSAKEKNTGRRYTIKVLEKMRKSLNAKLKKINDQQRKDDDNVTFEELGIDRLFVDESHGFKNLFFVTKMRNVAGISQSAAQKSSDLFMKCRYLDEITGSRGVVFASGTFISNSMVEFYTNQRYLQYEMLKQVGLHHFDAWASTFGETITAIELAPEGSGYRIKTRFAKFHNLPELMSMFRMVADIQTADMLNLPTPVVNFHTEVSQPSQWQEKMVEQLAERAEKIRAGGIDPTVDNMLKIVIDGKKLALDQRLINSMLPDDSDGKVATCTNNVFRIWEETKDKSSTQLIFCDSSTPPDGKSVINMKEVDGVFIVDDEVLKKFKNIYEDIKIKLIKKGIPQNEIAFIHEATTDAQKKALFAKMRKGQVRILMGSTQKMGAGMNVQDLLIALHDLDCPYRPSDLEQRLGRGKRQGNKNEAIEVFRYVTEGTFDSYLYQLVENKQRFISQIMTSKVPVRSMEDVDETALSYAEIKALATGNPQIIEKCQLEMDVNKLKILHASHLNQRYTLEDKVLKEYPQDIGRLEKQITDLTIDLETVKRNPASSKDYFPTMKIKGISYTKKEDAGQSIIDACHSSVVTSTLRPEPIGEYRGFQMSLAFDSFMKEYCMTFSGERDYKVSLGTDVHGNITRIDNELGRMGVYLESAKQNLTETISQLSNAKEEMNKPFLYEDELQEKSERLDKFNIELNLDQKDPILFDSEPDQKDGNTPKKEDRDREL